MQFITPTRRSEDDISSLLRSCEQQIQEAPSYGSEDDIGHNQSLQIKSFYLPDKENSSPGKCQKEERFCSLLSNLQVAQEATPLSGKSNLASY